MEQSMIDHLFITTVIIIHHLQIDCVYTANILTGSIWKGGTDSTITLTLYDASGYGIRINNIESWGGLMGSDYDYFERGNLDIFSGRGPCLTGPSCEMNLTSDETGSGHGWYYYVEVTNTGVHMPCAQQQFEVEQWLATNASPYELTTIRNVCDQDSSSRRSGRRHAVLETGYMSSSRVEKSGSKVGRYTKVDSVEIKFSCKASMAEGGGSRG